MVVSMDFHWKFRDALCLRHGWLFLWISIGRIQHNEIRDLRPISEWKCAMMSAHNHTYNPSLENTSQEHQARWSKAGHHCQWTLGRQLSVNVLRVRVFNPYGPSNRHSNPTA